MNISKRASWFMIVGLVLMMVSLVMYLGIFSTLDAGIGMNINRYSHSCNDGLESSCLYVDNVLDWIYTKDIVAHVLFVFGMLIMFVGGLFGVYEK